MGQNVVGTIVVGKNCLHLDCLAGSSLPIVESFDCKYKLPDDSRLQ